MKKLSSIFLSAIVVLQSLTATAAIIEFEDFAQAGDLANIGFDSPSYTESGFTFTPSFISSAVFDSAHLPGVGNGTDWFGFDGNSNQISLTDSASGSGVFSLQSMDVFIIDDPFYATSPAVTFSALGAFSDGSTASQSFSNISAVQTITLGWSNLTSVLFTSTDGTGFDNVSVNEPTSLPEPGSFLLFGIGLFGVTLFRPTKYSKY